MFRDHLIAHPGVAAAYAVLKRRLSAEHANDREAYTKGKSDFIATVHASLRGPSAAETR